MGKPEEFISELAALFKKYDVILDVEEYHGQVVPVERIRIMPLHYFERITGKDVIYIDSFKFLEERINKINNNFQEEEGRDQS